MQNVRIIGFSFENILHWQFEFRLLLSTASEYFDHVGFQVLEADNRYFQGKLVL